MYELCNISGNTYYINCPAKIGLYLNGNDVYLIDSGNDKDAGKKVKRIIDSNGWVLKAIINTHSHADHIGGNKYLQQQTGCKIFAKGIESAFTLYPILEPAFLSGSYPSCDLLHKFLYAQDSNCQDIASADFPTFLEVIDLPGHSFEMIGIRTPDNVLFIADSISSQTIEKYGVTFIYDIDSYLATLETLDNSSADFFVPSHADICTDISDLLETNRNKVLEIAHDITNILVNQTTFEELLTEIFNKYELVMTAEQYVLIGSTVKSYLSYLKNNQKIQSFFYNNKQYWKTV